MQRLYTMAPTCCWARLFLDHDCEASKTGLSKQTKSKSYSAKQRLLPLGNIMPVNAYRASKLLKPFMPQLRKMPVCVNDCCTLPAGYPADDETCCSNPSCNQPMFVNGKARKTFRTLSVQSVVKAAFASKDLAAELKKDPPVSSHASILRG